MPRNLPKLGDSVIVHYGPGYPLTPEGAAPEVAGVVSKLWGGLSVGVHLFLPDGKMGHDLQVELHTTGGVPAYADHYATPA
jgi:hypothetical protein